MKKEGRAAITGTAEKWVSLCAGILLQVILGSIYAWSAFIPSLAEEYGFTGGQCGLVFGVMLGVFAAATIPAGRYLEKKGPRRTAAVGAVLFGGGYLLSSLSGGSFPLVLAGIGVISGVGVGFGYVCPLSVGMKWFPEKKGLITGVSVAGFGGGAIVMSFLSEHLLGAAGFGVLEVFGLKGVIYGGAAFACAMFMSSPRTAREDEINVLTEGLRNHVVSMRFLVVCLGMFAGTFAGLLVIGNLKPMMLGFGLEERQAVLSISMFAAGNVAGRILWGKIHDILNSRRTIMISLAVLGCALALLLIEFPAWAVLLVTLLVGAGFGGCFVVYASSIAEIFGVGMFPKLYPLCFLFYGLAALTGPPAGGWIEDVFGSYVPGILVSITVIAASMAVIAAADMKGKEGKVCPAEA